MNIQKITPFLWFDNQAEEAMNFYLSIFSNSRAGKIMRMPEGGPGPTGSVLTATFYLEGQEFVALNGGPQFKFTEAISFAINCNSQEEVDHYWYKLIADGGEESMCGWLKDKFGLSWQVTPTRLIDLVTSSDSVRAQKAFQAMMQMRKIDIATIEAAYNS